MSKRIGLKLLLSLVCVLALGLAAFFGFHAYALSTEKQVGGSGYLEFEEQETPPITYDPTDATFIAPDVTQGFTATTVGNTTTYTRDNETYVVTTSTSGSTTTTTHTFTNGSRVTTFTTEDINGTDVTLTALNVTGGETPLEIVIPDNLGIIAIGNGSSVAFGSISTEFTITLPADLQVIRAGAFAGSGATTITFTGDALTEIQMQAFASSRLAMIFSQNRGENYLPMGLQTIGAGAFEQTAWLSVIGLPETLTTIMPQAFAGSNLQQAYFDNIHWQLDGSGFDVQQSISAGPENAAWLLSSEWASSMWTRI